MTDRWFSQEELAQLSRPTMDRAIEAIDAGDLREAARQCPGIGVIVRQPVDMMVERMDTGGCANAGLTHRAAEALFPAPYLVDEIARTCDSRADRCAQSF